MKVLIDGKEVEVLNDVKVIWDDQFINDDCDEGNLILTANHEGVVLDACDKAGELWGTTSIMADDLVELCY